MNTYKAILKRRSIRKYSKGIISSEVIEMLLQAAMAAPSARNAQPWEFYVVTNKEVMLNLRSVSKNLDFDSSAMIIVCGNNERSITKNDNDFWIQDCSAAVENILLAATELGLGTLWCGLYPVLERSDKVREYISAPMNHIPMALIHIGYPDEEKEERTQFNENYVHYVK